MDDEIGERLGVEAAALTHGIEGPLVGLHGVVEVLHVEDLVRGDEEPVVEGEGVAQVVDVVAALVVDVFVGPRDHDEIGHAGLDEAEHRLEVAEQDDVDVEVDHLVERQGEAQQLAQPEPLAEADGGTASFDRASSSRQSMSENWTP